MQRFVYGSIFALLLAACGSSSNGPVCGDGVVDRGEQCDDGANNGAPGDTCSATCTLVQQARCGDGTVDPGEQCDEGASNGTAGAHCSMTCTAQAYTTANWQIKDVAGTVQACPQGYDTAALYSQALDANGNPVGQPTIDLFNCADGTGTSAPLAAGTYQSWIAITSHDGSMTYAQSLSATVDLTTSDKTLTADIYTDGGYFQWAWTLVGAHTGSPLTCADVPTENGPEITSTVSGGPMAYSDDFNCGDGQGVTSVLPMGSYTCAFDLIDNEAPPKSLGSADPKLNETIMDLNQVTNLGTVQINVNGL